MAELILRQYESPEGDPNALCGYGYFDGTPTSEELLRAGAGRDGVSSPARDDNAVSARAGLQRWFLSQYC